MNLNKKTDSILDNLYLASPCSISWDSMQGDERERSCGGCSRAVYNISDMTRREAEEFLTKNGTAQCLKFYRRSDGTIMTDDCPRALRKIRDGYRWAARVAAAVVAFAVSLPSAVAQSFEEGNLTPVKARINNETTRPQVMPYEMNGGGSVYPGMPALVPTTTTTVVQPSMVTTRIDAKLLTKEKTLPDGRRVTLVSSDDKGRVIKIDSSTDNKNDREFIDTRADDFYRCGLQAKGDNNMPLAEFYFEKALTVFDEQKTGGDAKFRQLIESELKTLQNQP